MSDQNERMTEKKCLLQQHGWDVFVLASSLNCKTSLVKYWFRSELSLLLSCTQNTMSIAILLYVNQTKKVETWIKMTASFITEEQQDIKSL